MNTNYLNKVKTVVKKLTTKQLAILTVVVVITGVFILNSYSKPKRSVENYCNVYRQERERLLKLGGDLYPSGIFDLYTNDANEISLSLNRLSVYSPSEITSQINELNTAYKLLSQNRASSINISLTYGSIDEYAKNWTFKNCQLTN